MDKHCITLTTKSDYTTENWLYTAQAQGYKNIKILGVGEKWQGWAWRAAQYKRYLDTLEASDFALITDCNDVFFVRGPDVVHSAYERYFSYQDTGVLFGGEPTCCVGNANYSRSTITHKLRKRTKLYSRWLFPNAGVIYGPVHALRNKFAKVLHAPDDQEKHLLQYIEDESYLCVDTETRMVANINKYSLWWYPPTETLSLYWTWKRELKHWSLVEFTQPVDTCRVRNARKFSHLRNKETLNSPAVLHFPGKNMKAYNMYGRALYGSSFYNDKVESAVNRQS